MNITEKKKLRIFIFRGNSRLKFFKDVQLSEIGLRLVETLEIFPAPAKCLPFRVFDAASIYAAILEDVLVLGGEIFSNDRNHAHVREIAGRECEVCSRSAENIFART